MPRPDQTTGFSIRLKKRLPGLRLCLTGFLWVVLCGVLAGAAPLPAKELLDPLDGDLAWTLAKEENGIRVYSVSTRTRALVFKAEAVIDTTLEEMLALVVAVDQYTRWLRPCKSARELARFDELDRIGHVLLDAGTFFSNRDLVVHARAERNPASEAVIVRYESLPDYLPRAPKTIRITDNRGAWTLVPLPDNRLHMTWTGRLHPGGWFPTWLLKMLCTTVIMTTFEDIIREVGKETVPPVRTAPRRTGFFQP